MIDNKKKKKKRLTGAKVIKTQGSRVLVEKIKTSRT